MKPDRISCLRSLMLYCAWPRAVLVFVTASLSRMMSSRHNPAMRSYRSTRNGSPRARHASNAAVHFSVRTMARLRSMSLMSPVPRPRALRGACRRERAEFSWAVFIVWHGAHKGCRFATSCAPPSARGAMWSACHPGCRSNLHVAHRCSNRYESASRSARMSPRRATIFAPKKKLDERGSPVGDFPFSPAFFKKSLNFWGFFCGTVCFLFCAEWPRKLMSHKKARSRFRAL